MKPPLAILEPNSLAWLEALYRADAMLAEHVRAILADAGRADVCSICGAADHPADYQIAAFRPMTLRLCAYCSQLYCATYGTNVSAS